ncbi:cytochrome c biogenesis heme-transporting ATPase CcmA [Marinobacter sp. X15-166B]|uniref:cytochrome c biogenesis heme-transporting ATPase CcmA n=1 Tax=Marinobacter sp. X15-166B TaxID=1897620 RepID=UPI00085C01B0|nr:cytochrome c biogenesis heme-transporting ATPase CcmA [Marinobacter sp. X15-166B]OEY67096.1 heme ABC transporter ATP-binding protein CcmA [Marinobacter sp. X15-166B]
MSKPLLQATNLQCERDGRVLFDDLSLTIMPATLTRVEGPNGAGKTTLLRILAGLNENYSGEVHWLGAPRAAQREMFQRNLLYIGHRTGIKAALTAQENLAALMAGRHAVSAATLRAALAGTGLAGYEDVPCSQLSAGQQRRVALARLLISDEPLWILDEAFTALDTHGVAALERLLSDHAQRGGAVVVTTHHDLEVPGMQRIRLVPDKVAV